MVERKKEKFIIDDVAVWVKDHKMSFEHHMNNICPLCRMKLETDDNAKFIVNNQELFPNCFVHVDCFNRAEPEEVLKWLYDDYNGYLKMLEEYRCWG